jgi:hypothetical protein
MLIQAVQPAANRSVELLAVLGSYTLPAQSVPGLCLPAGHNSLFTIHINSPFMTLFSTHSTLCKGAIKQFVPRTCNAVTKLSQGRFFTPQLMARHAYSVTPSGDEMKK